VRLLARLYPARAAVGEDADPADEVVRFRSDLSPVFPSSEVRAAEPARADEPAGLEVRFMGVATPASFGSLPRRYAEQIRALVRDKQTALRDFVDLFNHRLISLFFRANERHRPAVMFERGPGNPLERALAAVLGLGTRGLADRMALPDRALFARAGLLARRPLPALALRALLESIFGVGAELQQFRVARYRVEPGDRSMLGVNRMRLGEDLLLGEEIVLLESKFRAKLGPLTLRQHESLLPDQPGFRQLCDLLRFATRGDLEFDVQLALIAQEIVPLRLASSGGPVQAAGRLGWSSWIGRRPGVDVVDDVVLLPGAAQHASTAAHPGKEAA
jgi:type VI secretion system protein ImpH